VETSDGDDERATDARLAELTPPVPDDMVTPSNPLVVAELYDRGLSTDEIAEVFSDDSDTRVKASQIRRVLRSTGLVQGPSKSDGRELGDLLVNLSDDINTEAVARDPHISVERNSDD